MLVSGTCLSGRYEILSLLGSGGMGLVYQSRDLRLGRDVAVKILPQHLAQDPVALSRFDREARALASLSHANILAIHDFQTDQGISFAVMELLQGETLRQRLSGKVMLPWTGAFQIGIAIADGLTAAHSRGVVHRDLKPENIFLTTDGAIKILDFGLAHVEVSPQKPGEQSSAPTQETTSPGTVVGTMHYMSPEQLRGVNVDARTDIFAFGCILYEMLTGARAFIKNTSVETAAAILKEEPANIPLVDPATPADAKQIIAHCVEKDPQNRFQTARDLSFALKAMLNLSGSSRIARVKSKKRRSARKAIQSIAILPLENTAGSSTEYLSDGITESLINSLSQLPKLRVMARSTVFRYKGQRIDPLRIGEELDVAAVLTGRIVQRGDALMIQAELVDVSDGSQLWGEHYTRGMSDILSLQDEISREISAKLRVRISGEVKDRLTKRYTESTEAYELYMKGRYYWNRRTADGLKKGIEFFNRAIETDPSYALAYAGIADSYNLLSAYGAVSPKESVPIAKQSALKALDLDPEVAEGHEALAHVKMLYDWDWTGAEKEFRRAIELNPNYAPAHQRYAIQLATMDRIQEATSEIKRASQIDPLSLIINTDTALILYLQGKYEQSIEQCYKALELDPNFSVAQFQLGLAFEQLQKYEEAIEAFGRGVSLSGDRSFLSAPAYTYAIWGKLKEAEKMLNAVMELSEIRYVSPYRIAIIHTGLGNKDKAFEWLMKAYQEKSVWLIHLHLRVDPRFRSLHSDPRFTEILRLIGF